MNDLIRKNTILELIQKRKVIHEADYNDLSDNVDAQLHIGYILQELDELAETIKNQPADYDLENVVRQVVKVINITQDGDKTVLECMKAMGRKACFTDCTECLIESVRKIIRSGGVEDAVFDAGTSL